MVYPCFACIVLVLQLKIKPQNGNSRKYNILGCVFFSYLSTSKLACVEGAAEGKEGREGGE